MKFEEKKWKYMKYIKNGKLTRLWRKLPQTLKRQKKVENYNC